jgi:hypothetical protein
MRRYNVPEEHIDELMRQSSTDGLLKPQKVLTLNCFLESPANRPKLTTPPLSISPNRPENRPKTPTTPSLISPDRPENRPLPPPMSPLPNPSIPPTPQSPAPPRTPPGTPQFPPFQGDFDVPRPMPSPKSGKK